MLTAIFKAFPSIESIIAIALEQSAKANAAEALQRKQSKDNAVDKAIDGGAENDGKND